MKKRRKLTPLPQNQKNILGLFPSSFRMDLYSGPFILFRHFFFTQKIYLNEETLWQKLKNKQNEIAFLFKNILSFLWYIVLGFFGQAHLHSPLKWKPYIFQFLTVSHFRPNHGNREKFKKADPPKTITNILGLFFSTFS